MLYRSKAPLRVSFAGGGTDVAPFPERDGGLVLSATINRYAYSALAPRADSAISVESIDYGITEDYDSFSDVTADGRLSLIKTAILKLVEDKGAGRRRDDRRGFDLFLHTNAPPGSGLGSSSAVMVALIGVLKEFQQMPWTDYEIAHLAYVVEREDLGIRGGLQDQYAAAFGGFNFMEFDADHVVVNPLRIPADVIHELEHNMLLCYTGRTRFADHIIDDQTRRFEENDADAVQGLRMQKELAVEMKNALLQRRLNDFGDLLGSAWTYKKQMSPHITTPYIDEMYETSIRHGALGGKVTGAGGGGYMLFFCPFERKHRVADALLAMGGEVTEFEFTEQGMTTWGFDG